MASRPAQPDLETGAAVATTVAEEPSIPNEYSAQVLREDRKYRQPQPLGDLQKRYGVAPQLVPPGDLLITELGTELRLTTDDWWRLDHAVPGQVDLVPAANPLAVRTPRLSLLRPTGFYAGGGSESQQVVAVFPTEFGPHQFSDWLAAADHLAVSVREDLANGIEVLDVRYNGSVESDGANLDLAADCRVGECHRLLSAGSESIVLHLDERSRLYFVDDPTGPVLAVAVTDRSDSRFFERTDHLLETATLGSSKPHPVASDMVVSRVSSVAAGHWRLAGIERLELLLEDETVIIQGPGYVSILGLSAVQVSVRTLVASGERSELIDTAGVIQALRADSELIVEPLGETELLGRSAEGIRVQGGPSNALLQTLVDEVDDPSFARVIDDSAVELWILDSPIGLLGVVLTASSFELIDQGGWVLDPFLAMFEFGCAPTDSCDFTR